MAVELQRHPSRAAPLVEQTVWRTSQELGLYSARCQHSLELPAQLYIIHAYNNWANSGTRLGDPQQSDIENFQGLPLRWVGPHVLIGRGVYYFALIAPSRSRSPALIKVGGARSLRFALSLPLSFLLSACFSFRCLEPFQFSLSSFISSFLAPFCPFRFFSLMYPYPSIIRPSRVSHIMK